MHEIISRKDAKARGDKNYFTGKPCPNGHTDFRRVSSYCCVKCSYEWTTNERINNPDFKASQNEICRINNLSRYHSDPEYKAKVNSEAYKNWKKRFATDAGRAACYAWSKAWREANPEKVKETGRKYRQANPEKMAFNYSLRACMKRIKKIKQDDFKVACLGYSRTEFKAHIESLFETGMSWSNHGEWHIDHVKPVHLFIKEGCLDLSVIHALSNLQPLWAFENQSKGGKF